MINTKSILKFLFGLCVWSFVVIGLIKLHGDQRVPHEEQPETLINNGRLLLQKENKYIEATSTTNDYLIAEILVDRRNGIDDEQLVRDVESRLPSLPLAYWSKFSKITGQNKKTATPQCGRYPSIFELEFNNIYWQTLRTTNGTFQLFGAYYDNRKGSRIGPAVRILGMIDRIEPKVKTFCQLWFDGAKDPVIVPTFEYKYIWINKWGNYKQGIYQPYLLACKIPQSLHNMQPASVSVVEVECDTSTTNLRVINNRPPNNEKKKNFAVCVKGLDFLYDDLSVRLVEWIELLSILGADKIFFYELQVHPNITKVLQHYEKEGRVQVTRLTLPGGQPNVAGFQHMYLTKKTNHKRQNEIIPYNDCLYKNMYLYNYVTLLDIDEVIMPKQDMTWEQLIERVIPKSLHIKPVVHSYNVRNVYFLDEHQHDHGWIKDIPVYMHMLQHVHRAANFTKPNQYIKCFHDTEKVLTLHNHFPLACLGGSCYSYPIEVEDAQLQHYRDDCVKSLKKTCDEYKEYQVEDTTVWKYKDELIQKTMRTLDTLGFFKRNNKDLIER